MAAQTDRELGGASGPKRAVGRAGGVGGPCRPLPSQGARRGGPSRGRPPSRSTPGHGYSASQGGAASIFSGTVPATFDPKKTRISVPSVFRNALALHGTLDLIGRRSSHSPCIEVWPKAVFDAQVQARTAHLDPFERDFERTMRKLVAHAHPLLPDAEGRMILPKELIEKAGLEGEVVVTGRHNHFQIWSAKTWEAALAADAEEAA